MKKESPDFIKISHATAISLGLIKGRMFRGAVNRCVNMLVHYREGCSANCAYCGLAKKRPGLYEEKSFIHVDWPIYPVETIINAINHAPGYVKRACISMITNGKCIRDTISLSRMIKANTPLPVSVLLSPTILRNGDLEELKASGVDKVGIALDLATPELFEKYRGKGVSGPHRWDRYWETIHHAIRVFGSLNVGVHLMVGMGETEKQMVEIMTKLWDMGVCNHLFSFFPEKGSMLEGRAQPPWSTYLRIQLARYLIENNLSNLEKMKFDNKGQIINFGINDKRLGDIISTGIPFMTSGCTDDEGNVACNRPFGNCLPDTAQWNYPYVPNDEEIGLIKEKIFLVD